MRPPTTKQLLGLRDLPPDMRKALAVLTGGERKMRAQEIKGNYEVAMLQTEKTASKMAEKYVKGQNKHYVVVIAILDSIIEA